jgi:hypothetical protein
MLKGINVVIMTVITEKEIETQKLQDFSKIMARQKHNCGPEIIFHFILRSI